MSYEFKKLSDVAIVETPSDTANVLIEENGVIKKAPKTAVGGTNTSGSAEDTGYDMVIRVSYDEWKNYFEMQPSDCEIIAGSFEQIVEKMVSDEFYIPKVILKYKAGPFTYTAIQFNNYEYGGGSSDILILSGFYGDEPFQIHIWNGEIDYINFPERQQTPS